MKHSDASRPRYWQKTPEANLLKNAQSGRYYARFLVNQRPKWISLDTDVYSVAKLRLADERAKIERSRIALRNSASGVATIGELAQIIRSRVESDATIGESTRVLKLGVVATLFRTWPELQAMRPELLTRDAVTIWRDRIAKEGTGHILPGAKTASPRANGSSASRINKCIDMLRTFLDVAVERGQLASNSLMGKRRGIKLPMKPKKPNLPESAVLEAIFADVETRRPAGAELCRFLAYTGCRLREAQGVKWGDVDFDRGMMRVRGTKTESSNREVPLIPAARKLLEGMKARRTEYGIAVDAAKPVLQAKESGIALKTACARAGIERLTHHDLRDAFATICIESGVDIPTVAAWLGHKDGGALLMRVYAHHRRAHSLAQAAKVNFGGVS